MRTIKYLVIIYLFFILSCNKTSNCKYCQDFISKDLSTTYKYQDFVLERDNFLVPAGCTLEDAQTSGTTFVIDIDSFNYIRKSMFCFVNMNYNRINKLLPKQIQKSWDTIGQDYILKLYLQIGDWNPKYPSVQVRRRGYVKKITSVGWDSLMLHFKMINDELIFTGNKDEIESYKSCYR